MNIAQTIPLGAAVMMLFMGGMMWMIMRRMGGASSQRSAARSESPRTTQSPMEILERRFAEGEISIEEYRELREVLTNGARRGQPGAGDKKRQVVTRAAGEE